MTRGKMGQNASKIRIQIQFTELVAIRLKIKKQNKQ